MLIIAILLFAIKLFFYIRKEPFTVQFMPLLQALGVIIVVSTIMLIVFRAMSYDEKWEKEFEERFGKPEEPSTFFDGWLHMDDSIPYVWGTIYVIAVVIIISCIVYKIYKGEGYVKILEMAAIPMIIYDIALMLDFKENYAQSKCKLPFPHVWYFEVVCCFIIIAILVALAIIAALIMGYVFIGAIMIACPVVFVIWNMKDYF